jgi:hypothetical protein
LDVSLRKKLGFGSMSVLSFLCFARAFKKACYPRASKRGRSLRLPAFAKDSPFDNRPDRTPPTGGTMRHISLSEVLMATKLLRRSIYKQNIPTQRPESRDAYGTKDAIFIDTACNLQLSKHQGLPVKSVWTMRSSEYEAPCQNSQRLDSAANRPDRSYVSVARRLAEMGSDVGDRGFNLFWQ